MKICQQEESFIMKNVSKVGHFRNTNLKLFKKNMLCNNKKSSKYDCCIPFQSSYFDLSETVESINLNAIEPV